ncbi:MAG: peptidoglycan DD-metalloendopeptidase family protein [Bdellovibrionales bacterium]|nr:peptidoglycan DD-metalloendopeptidase family protein [Bdellovibrionales bacterium]
MRNKNQQWLGSFTGGIMKVFLVFFISLFMQIKYAESLTVDEPEDNLNKIRNTYLTSKKRVLDTELKERQILSTLYDLNQKMKKMSRKRDILTNQMLKANGNAKSTAKEIALLEEKIKNQRKILSKRLRAIYKLSNSGVLPVIFSSRSSHDLDKVMKYLKAYSESDYKIISSYQKNLAELTKKRKVLAREVKALVGYKKNLEQQETELEDKQKTKSQILSKLSLQKKVELGKLKTVRKITNNIVKFNKTLSVEELLDDSFFAVKGSLNPPVSGSLKKTYGIIQNEEFRYKLSHKGHFYQARPQDDVRVVHKGIVSFVGLVQGYGNVVIVEHGDHYYKIYKKLKKINTNIGKSLETGDVIAKVGSDSTEFGTGMYFEIRHFSDSIDPKNWLVADNHQSD